MHVSHSIFSEVPLGSNKHTEDTEINLFDAERGRAFKTLPTPFFFCSSYEAHAGWGKVLSKQLSNWNAPEWKLSPWSPEDSGTLRHPCKEKRQGKSRETRTPKMIGFPIISYGISQDLWKGWHILVAELSRQAFPTDFPVLMPDEPQERKRCQRHMR